MMRRLFTIVFVFLVVFMAGLIALISLVNPNDYRHKITDYMANATGYRLEFGDNLRWHVWPKLSILTGNVKLTAPGAQKPLLNAENVRLDVKLWPLLSHRLEIEQVLLNKATVELTPATEAIKGRDQPIAPPSSTPAPSSGDSGWNFNIGSLQISDSLLIWQAKINDQQLIARDLNLDLEQASADHVTFTAKTNISRDQRDLALSIGGEAVRSDEAYSVNIDQFDYALQGANIPNQKIGGTGTFSVQYHLATKQIALSALKLNMNDVVLQGKASVGLQQPFPVVDVELSSPLIDLDQLLAKQSAEQPESAEPALVKTSSEQLRQSVVFGGEKQNAADELKILKTFNGRLTLLADKVLYRGLPVEKIRVQLENQQGDVVLHEASAGLAGGAVQFDGVMKIGDSSVTTRLQSNIKNVAIEPVLLAFAGKKSLSGQLNLQSSLSSTATDSVLALKNWQGQGKVDLAQGRLQGFNFQQMIQQAAERSNALKNYASYTDIQELRADVHLAPGGNLSFSHLIARSTILDVRGMGSANLLLKNCEINLQVHATTGGNELSRLLGDSAIPVKISGPWNQLSYQIDVGKLLFEQLKDRAKSSLGKWLEKLK